MKDKELEIELRKILMDDMIVHHFYKECRGDETKALKLAVIYYSKKAKKEFEAGLHKARIASSPSPITLTRDQVLIRGKL